MEHVYMHGKKCTKENSIYEKRPTQETYIDEKRRTCAQAQDEIAHKPFSIDKGFFLYV